MPQPTWRDLLTAAQAWADTVADDRIEPHHTDGIAWNLLDRPHRWHRCRPHSWGSCGPFEMLERCRCGAARIDTDGPWLWKNCRLATNFGRGPHRGGENVGDTGPELLIDLRTALREDTC